MHNFILFFVFRLLKTKKPDKKFFYYYLNRGFPDLKNEIKLKININSNLSSNSKIIFY